MSIIKLVTVLFGSIVLLSACANKKQSKLSPAQSKARLDSLLKVQEQEIKLMEKESLRDRMSIELKQKTDSILNARGQRTGPSTALPSLPDTLTSKDTMPATKQIL